MSFRVAGTRDSASCQKRAKREGFVAVSTTMASVGHLKRICKDAWMHVAWQARYKRHCSSDMLRGQGALLRWFCLTGARPVTWHHFFRCRRITLGRWSGNIATHIGTRPSALHSTFNFEGSLQTCFVFDVVNFENWGSFVELLCFRRCQVATLRKFRRSAAFLMLTSSKNWECLADELSFQARK